MTLVKCTVCGHSWTNKYSLDPEPDCEECGEATKSIEVDEPDNDFYRPAEMNRVERAVAEDPPRLGDARKKANSVRSQFGETSAPIDVVRIAKLAGYPVVEDADIAPLSGVLETDRILVNAGDHGVRQRFSVGHELGHHFMGTRHGDGKSAESEADAFSGELLIPGKLLREAVGSVRDSDKLRKTFNVSRPALEIAAKVHKVDDRIAWS